MPIEEKVLFEQLFEYQRDLTRRRWQYFATAIIFEGVLLGMMDENTAVSHWILPPTATLILGVLLLLLSRTRRRLQANGRRLNKLADEKLFEVPESGEFNFRGVSIWLMLSLVAMMGGWLFIASGVGVWNFLASGAIMIGVIWACRWTHT